jgi:hypothetical protein
MRGQQMLPRTIDGMTHVCYFRHALALDERRVKFQPEYAFGGTTATPEVKNTSAIGNGSDIGNVSTPENKITLVTTPIPPNNTPPTEDEDPQVAKESMGQRPQTLEVWFAGTHSDMWVHYFFSVWDRVDDVPALVGVEMLRTPAWIVVDHLWGGWCLKRG